MLIYLILSITQSCMLSTSGVGSCLPSASLNISFCKGQLAETVCVPEDPAVWNWTILDKDTQVRDVYILEIEGILELEVQGIGGQFSENINCAQTLKAIMCQINFPYCANDTSYPVCGAGCKYLNNVCLTNVDICSTLTTFTVTNASLCADAGILRLTHVILLISMLSN